MYKYVFLISNTILFLFLTKCWFSGLKVTKCFLEYQTGKTLTRLLLHKQSDLGLHCMSMAFWQRHVVFEILEPKSHDHLCAY